MPGTTGQGRDASRPSRTMLCGSSARHSARACPRDASASAPRVVCRTCHRGNERKLCRHDEPSGAIPKKKTTFIIIFLFSRLIALLSPHHDHPRPDVPRDEPSLVCVRLDERVHERLVAVLEHEHARVRGFCSAPASTTCRPPRPPSRPRCGPRGMVAPKMSST